MARFVRDELMSFMSLFGMVSLRFMTLGGSELHNTFAKLEKILPLSYGLAFSLFSLFRLLLNDSFIFIYLNMFVKMILIELK